MQINDIVSFDIYDDWAPYKNVVGVGFIVSWYDNTYETMPTTQFGELVVRIYKDGTAKIDTESMGKDHFLKLMELLYDKAEVK